MNPSKDKKDYGIELRSRKIRNILGRRPHWMARWGTLLITILYLIAAMVFIRHFHST